MKAILVANPKGGSGKTTLATNLAGSLATRAQTVYLSDLDRQQSSLTWLATRPHDRAVVHKVGAKAEAGSTGQNGSGVLIFDSAAGLHGKNLDHALKVANKIIVPVQPSVFDMAATSTFLQTLLEKKPIRKKRAFIGIVGMRVNARTRAAATLEAFLAQFDLPVLTYIRDTQIYVNAAFNGLTLFDLPEYLCARDLEQWQPILEWIDQE